MYLGRSPTCVQSLGRKGLEIFITLWRMGLWKLTREGSRLSQPSKQTKGILSFLCTCYKGVGGA